MSDDVRTCTCYKKIKSVAVIMSRKLYVLFEMEDNTQYDLVQAGRYTAAAGCDEN